MKSHAIAGVLLIWSGTALAQADVPSDVTFSIQRAWLQSLLTGGPDGHSVGARWKESFVMGDHSNVHTLASDCELHAAAEPASGTAPADPGGVVVEPPNVCKLANPALSKTGKLGARWTRYFDDNITGKTCDVVGFPRLFSEHAAGGEAGSSNPDHVVEIHPAISISCGGSTLDMASQLKIFAGMRQISDASAVACLDQRKLYVRQRGSGDNIRYEMEEEGAKGGGGRCGNFVVVDAHVTKAYIRKLTNGGDHVALADAWVGESGPFALKIYTYAGTKPDDAIAKLDANTKKSASVELELHGVLTYDYFTIAGVVQEDKGGGHYDWKSASALQDYVEVPHPLALVVFGIAAKK